MGRISRPLARRIDRASRAAHRFHRFAHHPLCGRYAGEVIPLGHRVRLCRGCTLLTLGLILGAGAGLWIPGMAWRAAALVLAVALWGAARRLRLPKLVGRGSVGVALGLAATQVWGAVMAAVLLGLFVAQYRRRGPDRSPCVACPERQARICSGAAPMVRRERAFQRLAGRWLQVSPGLPRGRSS